MNEDSAIGGATARRCARLLLIAVVLSLLGACTTWHPRQREMPPEEVALMYAPEPEPEPEPQNTPEEPNPDHEDAPGESTLQLPPPESTDNVLESTRRSVRSSTEWLARGVDSWFGDKPFEEGGEVKDGRLTLGFFKRQAESIDTRLRFNARIRLPNVERRAYFFVGRDNEREVVADTPGAFSRQDRLLTETREDRSFFTGLGLSLREAIDLRIGFHGIKPYAQARYHQPWAVTESDLVEFRQTFFWRLKDRLGSTTALSYEHALSPSLALRWLTAATITQKSHEFDWSSIVGAYKSFGDPRLLSLELIWSGRWGDPVRIAEYGVQAKWQQAVYRDWLLGEFLVGYFWPRTDLESERTRRWALGYTLTMRF